jgi:hypothetical protein
MILDAMTYSIMTVAALLSFVVVVLSAYPQELQDIINK